MTFRFLTPKALVVSDIQIDADDLATAFHCFERKHWHPGTEVGIWVGDTLIACMGSSEENPPRPTCVPVPQAVNRGD